MEAQRSTRLVILLTEAESAEVKRRAGLVPVSVWARARLLDLSDWAYGQAKTDEGILRREAERAEGKTGAASTDGQKISNGEVEVERREVRRGGRTLKAIEDVTHAALRKTAGTREPRGRCTYLPIAGVKCKHCGKVHDV